MDKLVVGILAHVDAGKTTLSEGLLYTCGRLKKLGRVDHQDAFLDTDPMERARGITIFSKQAVLPVDGAELTLLDTPGHADFSSEMERTLQVLDCAILVISGTDGVQGHTHTLWRLLERYGVPTFLFVNKMDLAGADKAALLAGLKAGLDEGCVDFTAPAAERDEAAALCGEDALERYLEDGALDGDTLTALIARRKLFPCWFGSALKLEGVAEFLQGLVAYAPRPRYGPDFAARVFKISRDNQGNRLTWMKLTGGALRVKEALSGPGWTEKADQLRVYSGSRFQTVDEAQAGSVVAVTGLSRTAAGEILEIAAQHQVETTAEEYEEIIRGKTAWLIRASCQLGALRAGADDALVEAAAAYGENIGMAFQIVDDALDFAPQSVTGKPSGGDVREGKLTPPLRMYRDSLDDAARAAFDQAFNDASFTDSDAEHIADSIRAAGFDQATRMAAEGYLDKARAALATLPSGPEQDILQQMADYVRDRKK